MNTTIFTLDSLGVTEYDTPFTGVSGDYECTAAGLYKVGGDDDAGTRITSSFAVGLTLNDGQSGKQRRPKYLYLHGEDVMNFSASVATSAGKPYTYKPIQRHARVGRFTLGAGLRDPFLKVSLSHNGALPFSLDQFEFQTYESETRRM